jgi:hypothetical protein
MTPETKIERRVMYAGLHRERFGSVRRLHRERPNPNQPIVEDPAVLMRRLRNLMAAVGDEAI